jgi:hypothetical protein
MDSELIRRQGLAKSLGRKDFWVKAFQTAHASGKSATLAAIEADDALIEYDRRFESL